MPKHTISAKIVEEHRIVLSTEEVIRICMNAVDVPDGAIARALTKNTLDNNFCNRKGTRRSSYQTRLFDGVEITWTEKKEQENNA